MIIDEGKGAQNGAMAGAGIVIALCFAIAVLEGFDIQAIGIAAPKLGAELGLAPALLGKALAASNIGLVIGAATGGWLADLWGRKPVLIGAVVVFGVFTLATILATSFPALFAIRLAVGLGFGAALPNLMAMAADVAKPGKGGSTATMMFCGMPAGGGAVALIQALNPDQDWRTLFMIGGVLPLIIVPALFFLLKETGTTAREAPTAGSGMRAWMWLVLIPAYLVFNIIAQQATKETGPEQAVLLTASGFNLPAGLNLLTVAAPWLALITTVILAYMLIHRRPLFGGGRAPASVLIWLNFVPTLLILYLILNWLPTLVTGKGFPEGASWASVWFNYGSVAGALLFGRISDRFGIRWPLIGAYVGLVIGLLVLGQSTSLPVILVMSGLVGFMLLGANYTMYGAAAAYYPIQMRGRGSGAAIAWGRLGSVAGPLLAGSLLQGGKSAGEVVLSMAPAAVIAGVAILLLSFFAKPAEG